MLELLAYLRANGFKTFIVSGGGIEFMRPWAEKVYGIPPEQVVGSSVKTKFELREGKPVIVRLPELNFIDDKGDKPAGIPRHIGGRPPVAAIAVLLRPAATMLRHAEANNARLLKVYPKGFALDASHRPHITLIQRFVRTADIDKVYAAAGQVLARANVTALK